MRPWRVILAWSVLVGLVAWMASPAAQVQLERGWSTVSQLLRFSGGSGADPFLRRTAAGLDLDVGDGILSTTLRVGTIEGVPKWPVLRATTSLTLTAADMVVASRTYSGPITITLPAPTSMVSRAVLIMDQAGLAIGVSNRTITVAGAINGGNNTTITTAFGVVRLLGGVSSGSSYQWFTW